MAYGGGVRARARVLVRVGVAGAVLAGVTALAVPAVLGSDLANTSTRTSTAPAQPRLAALPSMLQRKWQADGIPPGGGPAVQSGTVVVATAHRLEGRDPVSGATRWYYERRNATLCSWATEGGRVFAAFHKAHGCRDIVALDAGTGARAWYRNAELDSDITLTAMPSVLVAANPHALVAFDTGSSLNRWTYSKPGCTLSAPVPGDAGIGILASCGQPVPQLVLVDAFTGKQRFRPVPAGSAARVLSTTQSVTVLSGGAQRPTITVYGQAGTRLASFSDSRLRYADPARASAAGYGGMVLGWTGRAAFAVPLGSPRLLWVLDGAGPVDPADGVPLAASTAGFSQLALTTGRVTRTFPVPHGPLVGVVRVGSLVVASAADGTAVYG
jgi:hypothetical protein